MSKYIAPLPQTRDGIAHLVLGHEALAGAVVSLALAPAAELGLVALEVRIVLNELDERHVLFSEDGQRRGRLVHRLKQKQHARDFFMVFGATTLKVSICRLWRSRPGTHLNLNWSVSKKLQTGDSQLLMAATRCAMRAAALVAIASSAAAFQAPVLPVHRATARASSISLAPHGLPIPSSRIRLRHPIASSSASAKRYAGPPLLQVAALIIVKSILETS